jgi:hypothetical protein
MVGDASCLDPVKATFIVDRRQDWPFEIAGASVSTARSYLTDVAPAGASETQVINLCRASRYQGRGYYVSLLAEARGQRPLPDVKAIEDLQSESQVESIAARLDALAQETLDDAASERFELDAYFGADPAERHGPLAAQLFAAV